MKYTFKQFQADFPDDAACLAAIMKTQYGGTEIACPACKAKTKFHPMTARRAYACQECGHHVYPCAGTIFHKSRTKLTHWFFAMYLMTSTRHGVAAKELERQIGCTYKTAWRMGHELRKLMAAADDYGLLSGHIEVDETVMGGHQARSDTRSKGTNKKIVFGAVERDGRLRAGPIKDAKKDTLLPVVGRNLKSGSIVSTDELPVYRNLRGMGYIHGRVHHRLKRWVRGTHHTNTIEGHWSLLKRSIRGTHVHVSSKHLWKYVSEFSYRRNFRHSHSDMFNRLSSSFSLPHLAEH